MAEDISESQQYIFEQGYEVENLARKLFKKGAEVQQNFAKGRQETTDIILKGHEVIYQATACGKDLLARADILVYDKESKSWDIYEVKSSTEVKDEHIPDLTFQKIAFERSGISIGKTHLIHINKDYVKKGKVNPKKFFKVEDLTESVNSHIRWVKEDIPKAQKFLKEKKIPQVQILKQCKNPHACPFIKYCWKDIPKNSIYSLTRISESSLKALLQMKIIKIKDIYDRFSLTEKQKNQVLTTKKGQPIIDQKVIQNVLKKLKYPLYFLDYETFSWAIPIYDDTKPYQNICFQYSLHILTESDSKLEHREFLSKSNKNPIPELLKNLKKDIQDKSGTVIVWNKSFEMNRNKEMAVQYPKYAKFLESINDRIFDLMEIFSKQHYLHPDFEGSYSIKKVLPVLVPSLSYSDLEDIQEGGTASLYWFKDIFQDSPKKKNTTKNLLKYCELDTLAMLEIFRKLLKV